MTRVGNPYNVLTNRDDFNDSKFLKKLICWYTNADSLINKLDELRTRIKLYSPDIVCISEVFPKHCLYDIIEVELQISGYNCICSSFSHHLRGTCIYVKSKYKVHKLDTMNTSFQEAV